MNSATKAYLIILSAIATALVVVAMTVGAQRRRRWAERMGSAGGMTVAIARALAVAGAVILATRAADPERSTSAYLIEYGGGLFLLAAGLGLGTVWLRKRHPGALRAYGPEDEKVPPADRNALWVMVLATVAITVLYVAAVSWLRPGAFGT